MPLQTWLSSCLQKFGIYGTSYIPPVKQFLRGAKGMGLKNRLSIQIRFLENWGHVLVCDLYLMGS
jgi:hypothetical protein